MNIIEAIHNKDLFRPLFKDLNTWAAWLVLLKALFGLKLGKEDLKVFREATGREKAPEGGFKELWAIVGRRGGKSFMSAVIAVYLALFYDFKKYLSLGEVGVVQVIAADRSQAQVILQYIKGILHSNPIFEQYLSTELRESVELTNGIVIEVMSCSFRSIRGRTVVCGICDEISFWHLEGVSPDREILRALRPSMSTIPNSKLIVISSPYSRRGSLYEAHKDYYGKDDPEILVWQTPTKTMNPTIDQRLIDRELAKDPSAARAEWLAEFREDLEEFLSLDAIEACCLIPGTLGPERYNFYQAFTDPSGGRKDQMTLCIGHKAGEKMIVDLLKAWKPPFDPSTVVQDIVSDLKDYGISKITGDRYGAAWVSSSFEKEDVHYESCDKPRSDLYLNFEGIVNTRQIELPKNKALITELVNLERRRGKSGKDSIDHPQSGHDDMANVIAGVGFITGRRRKRAGALFRSTTNVRQIKLVS